MLNKYVPETFLFIKYVPETYLIGFDRKKYVSGTYLSEQGCECLVHLGDFCDISIGLNLWHLEWGSSGLVLFCAIYVACRVLY